MDRRVSVDRDRRQLYEYACHEGNYSLGGMLRGAREKEADDAAGKKGAKSNKTSRRIVGSVRLSCRAEGRVQGRREGRRAGLPLHAASIAGARRANSPLRCSRRKRLIVDCCDFDPSAAPKRGAPVSRPPARSGATSCSANEKNNLRVVSPAFLSRRSRFNSEGGSRTTLCRWPADGRGLSGWEQPTPVLGETPDRPLNRLRAEAGARSRPPARSGALLFCEEE